MQNRTHKLTRTKRHKLNDSPDTKNDSSMTEKSMDQQMWNCCSIASDNDRKFVDAKILDEKNWQTNIEQI